jgi:hypothetical protein
LNFLQQHLGGFVGRILIDQAAGEGSFQDGLAQAVNL